MAASGSPGPTPRPSPGEKAERPPPPLASHLGWEKRKGSYLRAVPSVEAVRGGRVGSPERPSRSRRGGSYCSALRPIVSLPRRSRRSRAREPGSSPALHLLPPLWKRPPPPRAAGPGPRLRAAGPARLTGHRQPSLLRQRPRPPPSWRGPSGPFPAARARCSRAPAVRGDALLGLELRDREDASDPPRGGKERGPKT
ncbi:PREDICTED: uncharacterized protein LOC101630093 [Condylura cristata]|uniref:uncharacterized protein LOC101630093 n=1 Tax=Condylura cristata TaxID=143302 RepID=UPI0003345186|nr:PREDICTED: uncharacterized protein LOC101630093 [Condylura cristata]